LRGRFESAGPITEMTAKMSLPRAAPPKMVEAMIKKLSGERVRVKSMIKEEVEKLMRLGAEVTGMTYNCSSSSARRTCITPKNMRTSYCQDGSDLNVKRIHWIFHELPVGTHQDILMQRRKHADWVVEKVQKQMNVRWAPKKEGETSSHKNCIEHMYKRIINEKKQTIIKGGDGNKHGRLPFVRHPKTYTESKKAAHYKRGKLMFYWKTHTSYDPPGSKVEHLVSREQLFDDGRTCTNPKRLLAKQVEYDNDLMWHQWNIAAKKRILMDTIEVTAVPMEAYYIEPNMTSKGSIVSSLGSTQAFTKRNEPTTMMAEDYDDKSPVKMKSSVPSVSNKDSEPSTVEMRDLDDEDGLDFDLFEGFEEEEGRNPMGWDGKMTPSPISDAVSKHCIPLPTSQNERDLQTERKEKV
jgi:hypothetical protein